MSDSESEYKTTYDQEQNLEVPSCLRAQQHDKKYSRLNIATTSADIVFCDKLWNEYIQINKIMPDLFDRSDVINILLDSEIINKPNIQFLNTLAYMFSYNTIDRKKNKIDKDSFEDVLKTIEELKDELTEINFEHLKPPDILRYARYWVNILKDM